MISIGALSANYSNAASRAGKEGLDIMMPEAINLKFIAAPLTGNQLAELIQIPPRK
jgi:hypothetical protein